MRATERNRHHSSVGTDSSFEALPIEEWRQLFAGIAEGSESALDRVFEFAARKIYGLALWRTASVEDARDVVQDVFVRLAERRHDLPAVRDPRSWLLTVAHRMAIDLCRKSKVRQASPLEDVVLLERAPETLDRTMDQRRATEMVLHLPPAQREVIYLHVFAGLTFAAVGDVVGIPTFTAASRYRTGIQKLRRLMEVGQ